MEDRAMVGEGASGHVSMAAGIDISGPLRVAMRWRSEYESPVDQGAHRIKWRS